MKSFLLRCRTGLWRKRICLVDKLPSLLEEKEGEDQHFFLFFLSPATLMCDKQVLLLLLLEFGFLSAGVL